MAAFTVWKFDSPAGAQGAASILKRCEADKLVKVLDHAVVSWPEGESHPITKQSHEETWRGTGWGALWGVLLGSLFFVPVIGGVAGAAIGAISKMTQDAGITKEQLHKIRTEVTPGTSALFAVTEQGDLDRVGERFHGMHSKLIDTNLTEAERQVLLETFGGK
ncbi:DUF1269 domain-containing protein [Kribbella sp. NBC_00709]|uniref:DUF1269 domain-containing protein n=1 Tax=Kribbella sp. NBC_00709 TaxID=2975972 RepID=UPI002E2B95C2|nr:DUF1269 domain-containing protein [Kribbella sp. NBC_00709]